MAATLDAEEICRKRNKASFLVMGLSLAAGMVLSEPVFADSRYHWRDVSKCMIVTDKFMACGDGKTAELYTFDGRSVSSKDGKLVVNPPSANDDPGTVETKATVGVGSAK